MDLQYPHPLVLWLQICLQRGATNEVSRTLHSVQAAIGHGKAVFYYRFYDGEGHGQAGEARGRSTRPWHDAMSWGLSRRDGSIQPKRFSSTTTQRTGGSGAPAPTSRAKRMSGKDLSRRYADMQRGYLRHHVLPTFEEDEDWQASALLTSKVDQRPRRIAGVVASTINHCFGVLRMMLTKPVDFN